MRKLYKKIEVSRHPALNDTDILIENFSSGGSFTVCFDSTVEIEVADDRVLGEKPGLIDPKGRAWRIA